jgi:hypothetical protein
MNLGRVFGFAALATALAASCARAPDVFDSGGGGAGGDGETPGSGGTTGAGGGHATSSGSGGLGGAGGGAATADGGAHDAGGMDAGGPCQTAVDCVGLSDPCNQGTCVNGVCTKVPANDFGACDDGLFCTENEACSNGVCGGGTPKVCPGADTCHIGICDEPSKTCKVLPGNDGNACSDGDPCTATAACQNGACVQQTQKDCSFLDGSCATGACDKVKGCIAVPDKDGTPCDDGLYCTIGDACASGVCTGKPNTCAPPGADICMVGQCDEGSKTCIAVPGNDGKLCNDGNVCTAGETCSGGKCLGGKPANDGAACDDGNACTSGTSCLGGTCTNAKATITQCIDGDGCCPPNCPLDKDCLWWASGVQQNVAPAQLTGWSQCYADTYDVPMQNVVQSIVQQQCTKGKLMLACRQKGAATWQLAAMGQRADVLFDCGSGTQCTHQANGVGWYYSATWSWGFANGADAVSRNECDVNPGPLRLCWHTVSNAGGYRCGDTTGLNSNPGWERAVFQAD